MLNTQFEQKQQKLKCVLQRLFIKASLLLLITSAVIIFCHDYSFLFKENNRALSSEEWPGWDEITNGLWRYHKLVLYEGKYYAHYHLERPSEEIDSSLVKDDLVKIIFAEGDLKGSYHGGFKDGKPHGHGTIHYADGTCYDGDFENNQKSGCGTYWWPNSCVYSGEWKHDKANGYGSFTYANGDTYNGQTINYKRSGHGTYRWPNGEKYVGEWLSSRKHGIGCKYAGSGTNRRKYKEKCNNDQLVWRKVIYSKG